MASAGQDAPAAAQAMPAADEPAAAAEETQAHEDATRTAPATEGDEGDVPEPPSDVPEPPGGADAGGTGAEAAMPPYAYSQGAPPAFGLPDAYLPPWLQGTEGMPMPFTPFSPPYYYQGPYMDVAEAYDAASAAANGGYVGAGAFALPPSPLLTPSMIGALSLSPMSMMSPISPAGGMQMPPLYAMPDGGASFDPAAAAAALAQFQQHHMLMSPQAYMPAGPYAMAPQMYDGYEAGDVLPSPRHQQEHGGPGSGRARGAASRTGRSGMVVPPPLPAQQQQQPREVAGAPAGGSPPSSRAAEPSARPPGRTSSGAAPAAGDAPSSSAAAATAEGPPAASQRSRRVGVSASDVLSETSRGPRAARGVSPSHAEGATPAAPVAAAPSEDTAVAAAAAALTSSSAAAEDGAAAAASERSGDGGGAAAPPEAPVDVAALLSCRSLAVLPPAARFFVVKSYSEDDVHKAIKYGCWSSTPAGNKRLDAAYRDACAARPPLPVLLLFSVNASGQFCGVAQLASRVDASATAPFWQQSAKWTGSAQLRWHAVKDVPNAALRHVAVGVPPAVAAAQHANALPAAIEALAIAASKPLTNSRDTQELSYAAGVEALRIIRDYPSKTSLLGDFQWYGEREAERQRLRAIGAIAGGATAATAAAAVAVPLPLPVPTTPPGTAAAAPAKGAAKGSSSEK